ncbi:MAG: hypothetical protein NVSMB6_14130 [Burkholderiaceae bacterium]
MGWHDAEGFAVEPEVNLACGFHDVALWVMCSQAALSASQTTVHGVDLRSHSVRRHALPKTPSLLMLPFLTIRRPAMMRSTSTLSAQTL